MLQFFQTSNCCNGCNTPPTNTVTNICGNQFTLSNTIAYNGPILPCTNIRTCDTINVAFQKIDEVICNLVSQISNLQNQINNITVEVNNITNTEITNINNEITNITQEITNIYNVLGDCCGTTTTTTTDFIPTTTTSTTDIVPTTTSTTTDVISTTTTSTTNELSTTTSTTTGEFEFVLGKISISGVEENACEFTLVNDIYIEGDYYRIYELDGVTPFNGSNLFWKVSKIGDPFQYSFRISIDGFVSEVGVCL
jgi:hypothetical protein